MPKVKRAIVPGSGTAVGVPELPPDDEVLPPDVDEVPPEVEPVAGGLGLGFHHVASAGAAKAMAVAAAVRNRTVFTMASPL